MKNGIFYLVMFLFLFEETHGDNLSTDLQAKFKNVLLVVHYNHPWYESVSFIQELYSKSFPNIVFYGDKHGSCDSNIHIVRTCKGAYFTRVMAHVFAKYPQYQGYVFLQDDCLMNFRNYLRFDIEKIWFLANTRDQFKRALLNEEKADWHFGGGAGNKILRIAFPQLLPEELAQYNSNHGEGVAIGEMCDMFYVPGKFAHQLIRLCNIFRDVFCELSVATILSCVENIDHWERLNRLWSLNCDVAMMHYSPELDWVHPLKFSNEKCRKFAKIVLDRD